MGRKHSVRRGAVNKQYENLFETYESPIELSSFIDLYDAPIPLFPLDLADYAKAAHMHLQHILGLIHQAPEDVCRAIEQAMDRGRFGSDGDVVRPLDFFTHLIVRYREFLIMTFQRTSRIEDTGATRGTSHAVLIFDLLLMVLLIQARMEPSLVARNHFDTEYGAVVRNLMAVHGTTYPISTYSQSQVYKSWSLMASRFLRVDLERDIDDLVAFRMSLLRRTASIVHMSETDPKDGQEHCRMLDMSTEKASGYVQVQKQGKRRQCAPRFSVEVMAYYVQTEILIHIYHVHIRELSVTVKQKQKMAASLLSDMIRSHRGEQDNSDDTGDGLEAYGKLFGAWTGAVRHHLAVVESGISNDHTAVERLANDIREHQVPLGFRTRFRFDHYLMAVSELEQLEGALYSNEKQSFIGSYRHRTMSFFTNAQRRFHDDPLIGPLADLHMIQQFLLNEGIEMLFIEEMLFADYDLNAILLRTPETVSSKKRGYFNVNNIVGMIITEETHFQPENQEVWQLPITMRNIRGRPEESMPAIIKLATHFYVYYESKLYGVEDAYEAFAFWMLIIIQKCRCHYVRRGRGKSFDLSFLKFYILERLNEVADAILPSEVRAVLVEQLGEPSAGRVTDAYIETSEVQAVMIDNMYEDMEVDT